MGLRFELVAQCSTSKARVSKIHLHHAIVDTPVFMPVGTQGAMKGITTKQLEEIDCKMILGNTYHLGLRPGVDVMNEMGGLHQFMNWKHGLLTDSGGFQMVSLLKLAQITEEGVRFQSPHSGVSTLLTPEHSMQIQHSIGADIIMQLDDVVSSLTTGERVNEAMERSIRWLDRCIKTHKESGKESTQNLFAIIQGGLDLELRKRCIEEMVKRDTPGYAIGGLSGGESKPLFTQTVSLCTSLLPANKPRYCMGVGYALDLVVCVALGVDMFDCVFPTRTGRFGIALVRGESSVSALNKSDHSQTQKKIKLRGTNGTCGIELKKKDNEDDYEDLGIEKDCECITCRTYTRGYLNRISPKETVSSSLVSLHNLAFQMRLMSDARKAIIADEFPQWVNSFVNEMYPNNDCPSWAIDALSSVGIQIEVNKLI